MGGGSTSQDSLARDARTQAANQAGQLDPLIARNLTFLNTVLGDRFGANWNALPGEVSRGYDRVRAQTEEAFGNAQFSEAEASRYRARTSGADISHGQLQSSLANTALGLDQSRRFTLGQIQLEEANAGMTANNALMRLFTGAGQSAMGLASTYQSQAVQGASQVNDTNPWGAALGGAASGASMGSMIAPGWGTVVGGLIGAGMGYMGSR